METTRAVFLSWPILATRETLDGERPNWEQLAVMSCCTCSRCSGSRMLGRRVMIFLRKEEELGVLKRVLVLRRWMYLERRTMSSESF